MTETKTLPSPFTRLHAAMQSTFLASLKRFKHIEAYPDLKPHMGVPALLYALTGWRPAQDSGTGLSALECRFQAAILVDATRPTASLQAAILASQLSSLLRAQYWDLDFVEEPNDIQAQPDGSAPELDQFSVWVVEWSQVLHIGDEQWLWEDDSALGLVFGVDMASGTGEGEIITRPEDLQ